MLTLDSSKARVALAGALALLARVPLSAQFSLRIEGPESLGVPPGEIVRETYDVLLGHSGVGTGAEAWSFGVTATGASVVGATTAGTAADLVNNGGFRQSGFEKTETIDPAQNGGRRGAVSSVVLSLKGAVRLPANAEVRVASVDAAFGASPVPGPAELYFEDGLRGGGPPVRISVIQNGLTKMPALGSRRVSLFEIRDCCSFPLNLGFSALPLRGAPPFEGLLGVGPLCAARDAVLDHAPDSGPRKVYLNIVSRLDTESGGAQGWAFNVKIHGGGDILTATTAGTAADLVENGGLLADGFNKTSVMEPARFAGVRGAYTGIVLSLTENTTLPLEGTESVLVLEVSGPERSTSVLTCLQGIRGWEIPIQNLVTVAGDSKYLCNSPTARIEVRHLPRDDFIRGNANGDEGLDIADPVWILNDLFHEGRPSTCADAADANDDGRIDLSDAVHLIRYLFLTGSAPPAPFPECGLDDTEDDLDCPGGSPPC